MADQAGQGSNAVLSSTALPSTFSVRELTGQQRAITFEGRALPYRSPSFGGTMRAEFTWNPGSPVATAQVLGPTEEPTTFTGKWKDKFIRPFDDAGLPATPSGFARLNGSALEDAKAVVDAMDSIRRSGQLLEVTWDAWVRHGLLTKFTATPERRQDIEWEMQFTWLSQGDPDVPSAFSVDSDQTDLLARFNGLIGNVTSTASTLVKKATDISSAVAQRVEAISGAASSVLFVPTAIAGSLSSVVSDAGTQMQAAVTDVGVTASLLVDGATQAKDAGGRTLAALQTLQQQASTVLQGLFTGPLVDPTNLTFGESLSAEKSRRDLQQAALITRNEAARRAQELSSQVVVQDVIAVFVAQQTSDLRDVATRYYGSPNEWKRIMVYNRLPSSALPAGRTIYVPKLRVPGDRA